MVRIEYKAIYSFILVYKHMVYTFRVNWINKTIQNVKEFVGHPRRHIHTLVVIAFITLILGFMTLFFVSNSSLESKEQNNIQAVTELNNTVGNISINTSQRERYEVMQQYNQLKEVSVQSENFNIERASPLEALLHSGAATSVNEDADMISELINDLAQDSNRIALEIAALDKYLQYSTAADFALFGQDDYSDAERVERALAAFQELINNISVSKDNVEIIKLSVISFNSFKLTGDIDKLSSEIKDHQLLIIENLSGQTEKLKSSFNSFYNSTIYQ